MENENLSSEEVQKLWNEEAAKLEADDSSADELKATVPDENSLLLQDDTPAGTADEVVAVTEPEPDPDPLAGMPDVVKEKLAKIDELAAANAQLLHHIKTAEGRVSAMQRELQISRQASAQVGTQEAPSQGQIATAAKNPEKWDQLKQDFPEWADAMEEYVASKIGAGQPQQNMLTAEQVAGYVQEQVAATKAEMGRLLEETRIEGKYENWKETVNTTDFIQWFSVQKPEVRALADSSAGKDALKMLDLFHATKSKSAADIKQEREQRLAAAATTRPGNSPPPKTLDDMSPAELWNYEAAKREKTKAQRGF